MTKNVSNAVKLAMADGVSLNLKKLFPFIMALSNPIAAQADSQAGGVPTLEDRVTVLENSVSSLQTTVTNLNNAVTALQTSVTNLQSANSSLQTALANETANRTSADNKLQTDLASETAARTTADNSIKNSLSTFDQKIQDAITATGGGRHYSVRVITADVPNGGNTSVAVLDGLPSGHFVVFAKGLVRNFDHNAVWACSLIQNDNTPGPLDQIALETESSGLNATNSSSTFALMSEVEMVNPGKVQVFCNNDGQPGSAADYISIIALEVAN